MKKYKLLLVFVSFIIFGCKNCPMDREYQLPKYVNDGLKVGTLTDVNIDTVLISKGLNRINCGSFGEVHSMVIYKDNLLVLEEYFQGHRYKWDDARGL